MKNIRKPNNNADIKVDLNEFQKIYRSVHQLAAMKIRTENENELFYSHLKQSTELLHHIHPGTNDKINQLLNFSFKYYMNKLDEAVDGDAQAEKIVKELKPLYQKELIALQYLN